jgi:Asp-tRNA(Asn)/Glu-tRNA(Gln) amidotransferase C subunit
MDRDYVARALELAGLSADRARLDAVCTQLGRIEEIAAVLDTVALDPVIDEIAPVWRP